MLLYFKGRALVRKVCSIGEGGCVLECLWHLTCSQPKIDWSLGKRIGRKLELDFDDVEKFFLQILMRCV